MSAHIHAAPQPAIPDGCVTLQSGRDGVWAHFRVGKGYAFSFNLDTDPMGKRFAEEYRNMLAAQEPNK